MSPTCSPAPTKCRREGLMCSSSTSNFLCPLTYNTLIPLFLCISRTLNNPSIVSFSAALFLCIKNSIVHNQKFCEIVWRTGNPCTKNNQLTFQQLVTVSLSLLKTKHHFMSAHCFIRIGFIQGQLRQYLTQVHNTSQTSTNYQ